MRYLKTTGRLLCGLILMYGASFTAQASLIDNGDFQTGDLTGWNSPAGVEVLTFGGGNSLAKFDFPNAEDGDVRLRQDFDVSASWTGINIEFDFKLFTGTTGTNPTDDFFKSLVRLEIDGSTDPDFTVILKEHDPTPGWDHVSAQVLFDGLTIDPVSPNARIAFLLRENTGDWSSARLDNVSVTAMPAVPVPAAVWLFGTAMIGLFGFNKRRKAG
jgi:hypothetical protein